MKQTPLYDNPAPKWHFCMFEFLFSILLKVSYTFESTVLKQEETLLLSEQTQHKNAYS